MRIVTLQRNGKVQTLYAEDGENLLSLLQKNYIPIAAPCGGRGTCGKCGILLDGEKVLACQKVIKKDCTVTFPKEAAASILTSGICRPTQRNEKNTGIAFDIGTTTVVGCLVQRGQVTHQVAAENAQKAFGADVVSRLDYALQNGVSALQQVIVRQLDDMIQTLCTTAEEAIDNVVIAGNTTMLHLLTGSDVTGLSKAPFLPAFLDTQTIQGRQLGFTQNVSLSLFPSISAYVGGDITAAMLACCMEREERLCLLVDIGTNGEMALGSRQGFTCTSVAAGPAFEGAQIVCGMSGVDGAISDVKLEHGMVSVKTVGEKPSIGICGSGLLDAVAQMLDAGVLDNTGRMKKKIEVDSQWRKYLSDSVFHLTPKVYLTQQDIRQLQYAKAAIAAGIQTLLEETGHTAGEVEQVYLAGGLGSFLHLDSAVRIGLLPKEWKNKTIVCGNAALSGSVSAVKEPQLLAAAQAIQKKAKPIELANRKRFEALYIQEMMF